MNFDECVTGDAFLAPSFSSINISKLVIFLLRSNPHITEIDLSINNIVDEDAKALATLTHLTYLDLSRNCISNKGAKVLATLTNLTYLDLSKNSIDGEGIEALARSKLSEIKLGNENDAKTIFYNFLLEAYSKNQVIDKESTKKMIFNVAQRDYDASIIKYILKQPDKYPFLINSRDEQGHILFHFHTNRPEVQKLLFEQGLIPEKELERNSELQNISQDGQSAHAKLVVEQTNFITKNLVKSIGANKSELEQAVTSYVENIPKLLEQYQNDQVRIELLSLPKSEKRSVMENTLRNSDSVPDDKEFIKTIIGKAKQTLEQKYLRKNQNDEYDQGYPTARLQYDYTREDAKVTIPESIGYIKLLIDRFSIPSKEKKELLVTLTSKNPELVKEKLPQIRLELGDNDISQEQITDRKEFHELLDNVDASKVDKLFKEISNLNIEEIWREQKKLVLLKQIYVAATAYGDSSACIQGTRIQFVNSAKEIDLGLMDKWHQYLELEMEQEKQRDVITKENITPFVEDLAKKLIEYVEGNLELKEVLQDHLLYINPINIDNPQSITLEQQKILAKINQVFTASIKEFLPNYNGNIPNGNTLNIYIPNIDEYQIIIKELPEVVLMQKFAIDGGSSPSTCVNEGLVNSHETSSISK